MFQQSNSWWERFFSDPIVLGAMRPREQFAAVCSAAVLLCTVSVLAMGVQMVIAHQVSALVSGAARPAVVRMPPW